MEEQTYDRVLVCIDGSDNSFVALNTAIETVKRTGATLDVLRVLDLNALEYGGAGIALDGEKVYEIEHRNEDFMTKLKRIIVEKRGLDADKVHVHLRFGNPKNVIVKDFQPEYQNDLIIVGTSGKTLIQRIVVGSVASYVVRAARCDVLMARTTNADYQQVRQQVDELEADLDIEHKRQ